MTDYLLIEDLLTHKSTRQSPMTTLIYLGRVVSPESDFRTLYSGYIRRFAQLQSYEQNTRSERHRWGINEN